MRFSSTNGVELNCCLLHKTSNTVTIMKIFYKISQEKLIAYTDLGRQFVAGQFAADNSRRIVRDELSCDELSGTSCPRRIVLRRIVREPDLEPSFLVFIHTIVM